MIVGLNLSRAFVKSEEINAIDTNKKKWILKNKLLNASHVYLSCAWVVNVINTKMIPLLCITSLISCFPDWDFDPVSRNTHPLEKVKICQNEHQL